MNENIFNLTEFAKQVREEVRMKEEEYYRKYPEKRPKEDEEKKSGE